MKPAQGFVEQNIIAQMSDPLDNGLRVIDGAVVGALLDDGGAERPLLAPGVLSATNGLSRIRALIAASSKASKRIGPISPRRCGRWVGDRTPPPSSKAP